ncbi:hypothetical protein [Mastigocoleus testarum]|nr:hypothetical protein [Mastigocoleus testarum]
MRYEMNNQEFESQLAEILQQMESLQSELQWNALCASSHKTGDMNLADAVDALANAVDRGVLKTNLSLYKDWHFG